jgi:hypothetical protein
MATTDPECSGRVGYGESLGRKGTTGPGAQGGRSFASMIIDFVWPICATYVD